MSQNLDSDPDLSGSAEDSLRDSDSEDEGIRPVAPPPVNGASAKHFQDVNFVSFISLVEVLTCLI
jgi:hypothetical protein